ncbi:1590_t:CDS:2 [Funneliformis geosporum]|nr:1590_t:CDS:2 [Funneliformis geosporum]
MRMFSSNLFINIGISIQIPEDLFKGFWTIRLKINLSKKEESILADLDNDIGR